MPFRTRADVQALRQAVGAFEPDRDASRIARLRMNVGVSARCHVAEQGATDRCVMVTLTYAGDNSAWCPSHVRTFMDHVRKWCGRQGTDCRYVWVAELQRRGVIHYHVALWLRADLQMPKPDACGWWPHGMTRIETARAAVPYLLKYLSKGGSYGSFPKGARTFGVGGLAHMYRRTRRWFSLPTFVRERSGTLDDWRRAKGGGWTAPDGSHWVSEFARSLVGGAACLLRVATHPTEWRPDGPYDRWTPRGAPC